MKDQVGLVVGVVAEPSRARTLVRITRLLEGTEQQLQVANRRNADLRTE